MMASNRATKSGFAAEAQRKVSSAMPFHVFIDYLQCYVLYAMLNMQVDFCDGPSGRTVLQVEYFKNAVIIQLLNIFEIVESVLIYLSNVVGSTILLTQL